MNIYVLPAVDIVGGVCLIVQKIETKLNETLNYWLGLLTVIELVYILFTLTVKKVEKREMANI